MLDELLRSDRDKLLNQARYHSASPLDADDALGDACVSFLRHYRGDSGLDALRWMQVVVKHAAWAISRRRALGQTKEEVAGRMTVESRAGSEERLAEIAEMRDLFKHLKPDERTALILLGLGYSYEEIRALRGWTQTKVNRCLAQGRQRIRNLIAEADSEKRGERI